MKTKEEIIKEYEEWDNVPEETDNEASPLELVELNFIFEKIVVEENSK